MFTNTYFPLSTLQALTEDNFCHLRIREIIYGLLLENTSVNIAQINIFFFAYFDDLQKNKKFRTMEL